MAITDAQYTTQTVTVSKPVLSFQNNILFSPCMIALNDTLTQVKLFPIRPIKAAFTSCLFIEVSIQGYRTCPNAFDCIPKRKQQVKLHRPENIYSN